MTIEGVQQYSIMQSPSKVSEASGSAPPATSVIEGWAELPEGLLHSIVALLGSFLDLLAFTGTCHSWRAAFSSYPSKSNFRTILPPLLVRPNVRVKAPSSSNGHRKLRSCEVIDLANRNTPLRCQIPQETLQRMHFAGSSHGQLICCRRGYCLVVDVFTGAEVSPPRLPFSENCDEFYYCGILTAPITSPNSHLIISTQSSLFDWPVGSDSWSELKLPVNQVDQIVEFNGQLIAVIEYSLYTLQLAPILRLEKIKTLWWDNMNECPYMRPWFVVCGDMLLIVDHYISFSFGAPVLYRPYRLDMSTKPAKWVEVKKLENWALFIGGDARSPPFSFKNPERWGGRSNCLYYAHYSQPLSLHGLGDDADAVWDPNTDDNLVFKRNWYRQLQALWVYPSMFYSEGDGQ
uniref:KIB1-4 beta-propeller domain-containing protein n=1 Tax=Oryza barthii TaxID=65489 RepID=A0A0D3GBY6_9ORYZ